MVNRGCVLLLTLILALTSAKASVDQLFDHDIVAFSTDNNGLKLQISNFFSKFYPAAPSQLATVDTTTTTWEAKWIDSAPSTAFRPHTYFLKCVDKGAKCTGPAAAKSDDIAAGVQEGIVTDLIPYTYYTCYVVATNKYGKTCSTGLDILTDAVPFVPPTNIQMTGRLTSIRATWDDASGGSGNPPATYTLKCVDLDDACDASPVGDADENIPFSQESGVVTGLLPDTEYSCYLITESSADQTCSEKFNVRTASTVEGFKTQTNFFAERNAVAQTRSISGITAAADAVYVGMIQSPNVGSCKVYKVENAVLTDPIGNCNPESCTTCTNVPLPSGNGVCIKTGLLGYYNTLGDSQPDSLSYDTRGYIWMADGSNTIRILDPGMNLYRPIYTSATVKLVAIVEKSNGVYYAYMVTSFNFIIIYDVSDLPDLTLGDDRIIKLIALNGIENPRQIAVDGQGNMYISGSVSNNVLKVTPDGVITRSTDASPIATLSQPYGVATYGNFVYVTNKVSTFVFNLKVLKASDLSLVTTMSVLGTNVPNPSGSDYVGFRSIHVDSEGKIYITDNSWDFKTSYLPPGGTISPIQQTMTGRIYFDRVVVGQL